MPDAQTAERALENGPPCAEAPLSRARPLPRFVFATLAAVLGVTVLSKVLGFLSQILVTSLVGTTGIADSYYFAFSIVNIVSSLGVGSAGFVLIPLYVEKKEREGAERANAFGNALLTYSLIVLAALSLLMILLAGPLVATFGRFPVALRPLALRVFVATTPLGLLIGAGQLLMALSQARKRFIAPAFMGVLHSVVFMAVLIVTWKRLEVYALVLAVTVSMLLQAAVLCARLSKEGKLLPSLRLSRGDIRRSLALAGPLVASQALSIIMVLASRNVALGLIAGSLAALAYAEAMKGAFLDLCVIPVAQISLPHFSEAIARGDTGAAWTKLQSALTALWLVVTPVVVLLGVLSTPLIHLFYQRGAFTAQSTALTASALSLFSLGLLGEAPTYLICRYFFALQDASTPTWVALPFAIAYVPVVFLLSRFFQVGGISMGHSLMVIGNMMASLCFLRRKVRLPFASTFHGGWSKIAISGLVMALFSWIASSFLAATLSPGILSNLLEITVVSAAGIATYVASATLAGITRDVPAIARLRPRSLLAEMQHLWMPLRES